MRATAALQTKMQIPFIPARYGTGPSVKALFKVYLHIAGHQHPPFPAMQILPYGKISLGQHWTKNN